MPAVARVQLHRDVDLRRAGGGEGDAVDRIRMRHRADDGDTVHDAGGVGQQLADVEAGDVALDRLQLAADVDGGARLGVERLELTRRAIQEEEDARLGAAEVPLVCRGRCVCRQPQRVGKSEAERAKSANLQEIATRQAIAERLARAEQSEVAERPREHA